MQCERGCTRRVAQAGCKECEHMKESQSTSEGRQNQWEEEVKQDVSGGDHGMWEVQKFPNPEAGEGGGKSK